MSTEFSNWIKLSTEKINHIKIMLTHTLFMSCGLTIESENINVYKWNPGKRDKWKLVFVLINIMPQMLLTKLVLNPEYSLKLCMTQFLCRK